MTATKSYVMPSQNEIAEATDDNPLYWIQLQRKGGLYNVQEAVSGKIRIIANDCYLEDATKICDAMRQYARTEL